MKVLCTKGREKIREKVHFSQYSEKWVGVMKLDDFFGLTNNPSVILERMTPPLAQGRLGLRFYQNVIRIYHLPFLNIFTGWMTHPLRSKFTPHPPLP